ncbi:MAG: nucleotide disphospho-sugar-binding domain-containing protein [Gemmatimonadota bacterium]
MAPSRRNEEIRATRPTSPTPPFDVSHILCMTTGLTGIVHASFEVVARLEAAGHRVSYACPHDVRDRVEAQGIAYHQLPSVDFSPAPALDPVTGPGRQVRKAWSAFRTIEARRRAALDRMGMAEFRSLLDELSPDLVLIDMELHDHIICAVGEGYRVLLICQHPSVWRRPGLPPIDSSIVPGRGLRGSRPGIALAWARRRWSRWSSARWEALRAVFVDRRSILRYFAREVGFPARLLEETNWPPPFTYDGLPVVSLASELLEFPHDDRPDLHYVGPIASMDRIEAFEDPSLTAELETIVAGCDRPDRALIVCTVTTMQGENEDLGFIRRLSDAVGQHPEWTLVMGLGGGGAVDRLGSLPSNVQAYPWIPTARLLRTADLAIQHGGIHGVNEALLSGVPMLMFSGERHDQPGNVARVEWAGLGRVGDRVADDVSTIARRIDHVLADTDLRDRLRSMAERAASPEARGRLASVVDRVMADA